MGSAPDKTHIILVNALVVRGRKILVSRRSFKERHEPGRWTIPGGKVEKTKGNIWNIIEKTLTREVKEETGVQIDGKLRPLINNTFIRSTGHHVVSLVFLCRWKSGKARSLEDTINIKWITEEDLGALDFPSAVKKYLSSGFKVLNGETKIF